MTTDNQTNHFTDEQVIAAAMVIDRNAFRVGEAESNAWETGRDFPIELSAAKQRIRTRKYRAKKKARAALVAATRVPVQGEPNDEPELVDVVLTTADIEQLAHLLVQLSPATQKNSGATVRRLIQEMNIKEVDR